MVKGVIFDMDGLMFDTERLWDKMWEPACKALGLPLPEDLAAFSASCRFAQGVPCKKGLKELLTALDDRGMPRIVASSSPRTMIEMNLQNTGTARYFHDVVSGTEVKHSKPAPDTFLLAAEKLHLDPKDCLVLEDSFNGVRAGRAAGCVTVMVPDMMQPTEEITQLYDRKCEDLLEVRDLLVEGKL